MFVNFPRVAIWISSSKLSKCTSIDIELTKLAAESSLSDSTVGGSLPWGLPSSLLGWRVTEACKMSSTPIATFARISTREIRISTTLLSTFAIFGYHCKWIYLKNFQSMSIVHGCAGGWRYLLTFSKPFHILTRTGSGTFGRGGEGITHAYTMNVYSEGWNIRANILFSTSFPLRPHHLGARGVSATTSVNH